MRRRDREITDPGAIAAIVRECEVCRLGLTDGESAYIVPLNFGYEWEDGQLRLYFHSASEGRKLALLRRGGKVAFEMECGTGLNPSETAGKWSSHFRSVMGAGTVDFLETPEEKRYALDCLMEHYAPGRRWEYGNCLDAACCFLLTVTELSAKEHK